MDKISDPKVFEYIVFQNDPNKDLMLKALDIVRDFIVEKKLVITGGMAIDFALKLKGNKLYDDNTLPDYDFFSTEHANHAYELGQLLCKQLPKLFPNSDIRIDAIPATHITTMRVRVNYTSVADITYLPIEIFEMLPTLEFKTGGNMLKFRHPFMQMIDQHRALSLPYENAPREVILHRWKKDMKRFNLLATQYPIMGKDLSSELDNFQEIHIDLNLLADTCIGGFAAVHLLAKKTTNIKLPTGEPLILYSDHMEKTVSKLIDYFKSYKIKYYNPYLDILPSKIVLEVERPVERILSAAKPNAKPLLESPIDGGNSKLAIHVYDSANLLLSAEARSNFHVADAQHLLCYFLTMHFLLGKKIDEESIYKDGYYTVGLMVESGARMPTFTVYGKYNLGNEHVLQRAETLSRNKEIPRIKIMLKPGRFVPDENKDCVISVNLGEFIYEESPLFQIDGLETAQKSKKLIDFINPVGYESSDSENEK